MEMNIFSSFIRFFESEIFLFNNKFGLNNDRKREVDCKFSN